MRLALVIAAVIVGGLLYQAHSLEGKVADRDKRIGELTAANGTLATALETAKKDARRKENIVTETARKNEVLTAQARKLSNRLTEALRNAQVTAGTRLPDDIVDPLCLRYRAAAGFSGDRAGHAPSDAHAREADTLAPECAGWRGMTVGNVLEWTGALLDHAGAERLDKAGIREWAAGRDQ